MVKALAAKLVAAHESGTRADVPSQRLTQSDCLDVQKAVMSRLGPVAGFKVGGPEDRAPILGPIPARYCQPNGGTCATRDRMGIELEVGFEVLRHVPSPKLPDRPQDYFRPLCTLELVDSRLAGGAANDPDMKFADLQINAGLVPGTGNASWDGSDFGLLTARLAANGSALLDGPAEVPGGSALNNLERLLIHLGDHCGGIQPGHILLTGSICGLPYFGPNTAISGGIDGLGTVSVNLV